MHYSIFILSKEKKTRDQNPPHQCQVFKRVRWGRANLNHWTEYLSLPRKKWRVKRHTQSILPPYLSMSDLEAIIFRLKSEILNQMT
jgi:hypothetical protein